MHMKLNTKLQHDIADLLWSAENMDQVNRIVKQFGPDAVMIRDMMLAEELDKYIEIDQAKEVLNQIRSK